MRYSTHPPSSPSSPSLLSLPPLPPSLLSLQLIRKLPHITVKIKEPVLREPYAIKACILLHAHLEKLGLPPGTLRPGTTCTVGRLEWCVESSILSDQKALLKLCPNLINEMVNILNQVWIYAKYRPSKTRGRVVAGGLESSFFPRPSAVPPSQPRCVREHNETKSDGSPADVGQTQCHVAAASCATRHAQTLQVIILQYLLPQPYCMKWTPARHSLLCVAHGTM